ncbi:HdeD family acid-resistance protein [Shinella sumterensis]|uniref:Uncharacterized membrane protein HdeD n=1 Tax=Rhizobium subbaraonis TaxID=908946 RepID=A0A285V1G9_9HYPH|nr:HdeD family acid-resistance protein [Rhizobium subbaraonis]WLS06981.1 HdeD family acid-resistance protein [Shinella sumterensis]SOC47893.1 uncharacterized membrane protein HdeD [Rhizobium subbaraonis]
MIFNYTASLDATDLQLLRSRWRWLLGAGIVLLLIALVALSNLLLATVVSVLFVGVTMLLAGAAHIVFAFQMKRWGQTVGLLVVGVLYVAAGVMTFWNPVLASTFLTLLMALSMLVAGIVRTAAGLAIRPASGWLWLAAAGAATVLVALVILAGWPVNSLWIIGALLAIDVMVTGCALSALALVLRRSVSIDRNHE